MIKEKKNKERFRKPQAASKCLFSILTVTALYVHKLSKQLVEAT